MQLFIHQQVIVALPQILQASQLLHSHQASAQVLRRLLLLLVAVEVGEEAEEAVAVAAGVGEEAVEVQAKKLNFSEHAHRSSIINLEW